MNLNDTNKFICVLNLPVAWAHTWADMRLGKTDRDRRENFRAAANDKIIPATGVKIDWWAFRIFVTKSGRQLDLDNVAKPIIDAFCSRQIKRDNSRFVELGLYPDDGLKHVRYIELGGEPGLESSTRIEIFGHIDE